MIYLKFLLIVCLALILSGCMGKPAPKTSPIDLMAKKAIIPAGNFYFYSSTCLHCKTVGNYVTENNIREKGVHFFELEINSDPANIAILKSVAGRCNINENDVSVPLLWYNQSCYTGSDQIINHFKSLGLSEDI